MHQIILMRTDSNGHNITPSSALACVLYMLIPALYEKTASTWMKMMIVQALGSSEW